MDSLSFVSTSAVLPTSKPINPRNTCHRIWQMPRRPSFMKFQSVARSTPLYGPSAVGRSEKLKLTCKTSNSDYSSVEREGEGEEDGETDDEMERALRLNGSIPGSSKEFVEQVSSRAYDMRRNLHQSVESSSYDVLEANPWRETSKRVYVLTHKENQVCTMRTRRNRGEVENELGMLFSKGKTRGSDFPNESNNQSRRGMKFQMFVEDVREGILVFEDQNEAVKYCDLLQGGSQRCEGVAEIEASSVFDLCRKTRALAVLFRRGRTPPRPESLQLNLRSRKHSLED